jgi:hypothetical protein
MSFAAAAAAASTGKASWNSFTKAGICSCRLKVKHAVCVEELQREVLPSRVVERVERARRGRRLPSEAAKQEAVVEGETHHVHGQASHAVELVKPARRYQVLARRTSLVRSRKLVVVGQRGDHQAGGVAGVLAFGVVPNVGQGRERIDERVTIEQRRRAQLGEGLLGPRRGMKLPCASK